MTETCKNCENKEMPDKILYFPASTPIYVGKKNDGYKFWNYECRSSGDDLGDEAFICPECDKDLTHKLTDEVKEKVRKCASDQT